MRQREIRINQPDSIWSWAKILATADFSLMLEVRRRWRSEFYVIKLTSHRYEKIPRKKLNKTSTITWEVLSGQKITSLLEYSSIAAHSKKALTLRLLHECIVINLLGSADKYVWVKHGSKFGELYNPGMLQGDIIRENQRLPLSETHRGYWDIPRSARLQFFVRFYPKNWNITSCPWEHDDTPHWNYRSILSRKTDLADLTLPVHTSRPIIRVNRRLPITEPLFTGTSSNQACPSCSAVVSKEWFPFTPQALTPQDGNAENAMMISKKCESCRLSGFDPLNWQCESCGERLRPPVTILDSTQPTGRDISKPNANAGYTGSIEFHEESQMWLCLRERQMFRMKGRIAGQRSKHPGEQYSYKTKCDSCGEGCPDEQDPRSYWTYEAGCGMVLYRREYLYYRKHGRLQGAHYLQRPLSRRGDRQCDSCDSYEVAAKTSQSLKWSQDLQMLLCAPEHRSYAKYGKLKPKKSLE